MRSSPLNRALLGSSLALAAICVFAAAAAAAADASPDLAKVRVTEEAVFFDPVVEFETLELSLSGPGVRVSRTYKERPVLRLQGLTKGPPSDGRYTWELRRVPRVDPEVRERLQKARSEGDEGLVAKLRAEGLLPAGPFVQTGSFTIADGRVADPGVEEKIDRRQSGSLQIDGDLEVRGAKKFRMIDPAGGGREILFAALEGPEVGTYFRGSARLVAGEAVVELPAHFSRATEAEELTAQLTPVGEWLELYVAELTRERLVVRAAGAAEGRFDFLVQGVRKGYSGFEVDRDSAGGGR